MIFPADHACALFNAKDGYSDPHGNLFNEHCHAQRPMGHNLGSLLHLVKIQGLKNLFRHSFKIFFYMYIHPLLLSDVIFLRIAPTKKVK